MTALRARAPGKVNLCLFLGPTRPDGLHEVVSVVESVSLADDLVLAPARAGAVDDEVVCAEVDGPNLAARALADFRRATGWDAAPQRLTVAKRVPIAAGMGGGSADAAAALRLAARAAGRQGDPLLAQLARQLGADVPAALVPGAALVTGAGEHVRPLEPLEQHSLLVVPSGERLATPAVFAEADRLGLPRPARALARCRQDVETAFAAARPLPVELMRNDLEPAACSLCDAIDPALDAVRAAGADRALVSGSGPTVVGIYAGRRSFERASAAADDLRDRFPHGCAVMPVDAAFGAPGALGVPA